MGVGKGGTQLCFRNAKYFSVQEREAKFGTRERGNANLGSRKKKL